MPGKSEGLVPAFHEGYSAKRLAALLGYSLEEFRVRYWRVNLIQAYSPGTYDFHQASQRAGYLIDSCTHPTVMILCGMKVLVSFEGEDQKEFVEYQSKANPLVSLVRIPHPSGKNRWWNDPENVELARRELRKYRV